MELTPLESRNVVLRIRDDSKSYKSAPNASSATLSVDWHTTNSLQTSGQTFINMNEKQDLFLSEKSFAFQINHAGQAAHDFGNYPCFVYPVDISIHSRVEGKINLTFSKRCQERYAK